MSYKTPLFSKTIGLISTKFRILFLYILMKLLNRKFKKIKNYYLKIFMFFYL